MHRSAHTTHRPPFPKAARVATRGHLRRNLIAYLALFFALSGTAIAAKPMLTGTDIQDASLTGADVQDDSLTGSDVLESSLAKVGDAETLDGKDSLAFARIAGRVDADGATSPNVINDAATGGGGSGFTSEKTDTGRYLIQYPAGTFDGCRFAFVSVTPGTDGEVRTGAVAGRGCSPEGGGFFRVNFVDGSGKPQDTPFHFIAVPSSIEAGS